ncbi:type IX secretion system motor protein PorM/GldM [Deminuibacter soli]|uniref:Gliding motility protein GldM n=1 Tax=Deminuibacter soli TaxID=2291815 RepID=A0A3E1NFL0_9BACT|nr:gliding motility protein GldM [Deminuibacter soli]RFM26594.1 gliding motility protein GldM [Deminuibacter soli]
MALPKEPRQKMINLMYLVLTALLALNVSNEILNAFKTVDRSLNNASATINDKNAAIFKSFEAKLKDPASRERAEKWLPKAQEAQKLSEDMFAYLEGLKVELKKQSGLEVKNGVEEYKEDNLEATTHLFVEGKYGKELQQKLADYKNKMLAIDPDIKTEFAKTLPIDLSIPKTQEATNQKWEFAYFHMTPTVAGITIMSKFQNDVRNSEAMVIDAIHRKVGEVAVVYDQFQAIASQSSAYLMPGQELTITGGVGAFSKAAAPTVSIDGATVPLNADGVAEYKTTVGGPGAYTKKVHISFKKPDGTMGSLDKDIVYNVGSPTGASVSADKVKVLYIGLPNDLSVSGGSVGDEKVQVKLDNGSLEKTGPGKYVAHPSTAGKANVTVVADGKPTNFEFRVKSVPDPVAMIGKDKGGRVPTNNLKAQQGVRAELENFVFEGVSFNVTSFVVYATGAGFGNPGIAQNAGAYFGADAKRIMSKLQPGSTLVIDEIKAVGPDGRTRTLPTLAFNCY